MPGYRLHAGDLTQHSWQLASVFTEDSLKKLTLIERVNELLVVVTELSSNSTPVTHRFTLDDALTAAQAGLSVMAATHPVALAARKTCYEKAATLYQDLVAAHGIRYPSPTRGHKVNDKWQAEMKPALRGSPFLALALADDLSKPWVTIQGDKVWAIPSSAALTQASGLSKKLKGYGRMTVQLEIINGAVKIGEISPEGCVFKAFSDIPADLRAIRAP